MAKRLQTTVSIPLNRLIMEKVAEHQLDLKALSERVGRNVTYLQQFVRKGVPKRLPRDVRDSLAAVLDVSRSALAT